MHRRTHVGGDAACKAEIEGARTPTNRGLSFINLDIQASPGQRDGGREPVGPGAHDYGVDHVAPWNWRTRRLIRFSAFSYVSVEMKIASKAIIDSENHGRPIRTAMPMCIKITPMMEIRRLTGCKSPTAKNSWMYTAK